MSDGSRRRPRPPGALLLVLGLAVAAMVLGLANRGEGESDAPLDPRSHEPDGASAMVALLRELGADVDLGGDDVTDERDAVALLLRDRLGDDQRDELVDWIDEGGTLVLADPGSPLAPDARDDLFSRPDPDQASPGRCDLDALEGLGAIAPGIAVRYEVDGGARTASCYRDGDGALVVAEARGDGVLVATGGPDVFTNGRLGERDNAALAAALLAPTGEERVRVVGAIAPVGGGDQTLMELIPDGVRRALVQLGIAFALYALWRAIRLGRPVAEVQPVAIAGSELVEATGRLIERSLDPARAAEVVRDDLRHAAASRLGVPRHAGFDALIAAVASRAGVDESRARLALGSEPVRNEADLLAVTRAAAEVRRQVLDPTPATTATGHQEQRP